MVFRQSRYAKSSLRYYRRKLLSFLSRAIDQSQHLAKQRGGSVSQTGDGGRGSISVDESRDAVDQQTIRLQSDNQRAGRIYASCPQGRRQRAGSTWSGNFLLGGGIPTGARRERRRIQHSITF